MRTAAIICEYNPLHRGHEKQFRAIRAQLGDDTRIVCLMSGNFVQRGEPAVFDRGVRAAAAAACGADLVLELPITAALSSAEGFAAGAVDVLERMGGIDVLCFGCETGDRNKIMSTAMLLHSPQFSAALHAGLKDGDSFAALRARTLAALGGDPGILQRPNDILAVEYAKALLATNSTIEPLPLRRNGSYHAEALDPENPSATALRARMPDPEWLDYVPVQARALFAGAAIHRLAWGERAVLARLRAMEPEELEALPYGSEGLWRRLMAQCAAAPTLDALIDGVKSRRYARSRISRMVLCAFLGLSEAQRTEPAPYVRILAFRDSGRAILRERTGQSRIPLLHAGERACGSYAALEARAARLYPLFLPPDAVAAVPERERVIFAKNEK